MAVDRERRRLTVERLAQSNELTVGMYVRVRGDELILGRQEPIGPQGQLEPDDRVKLTHLGGNTYGLSVRRHTGRWQKTPFSGSLQEMFDTIWTLMQHLVAPFP